MARNDHESATAQRDTSSGGGEAHTSPLDQAEQDALAIEVALAYKRLRDADRDAAVLAAACAYLAPEPVPVDWFTGAARRLLPGTLVSRLADPEDRPRLLDTLTGSSLASIDNGSLIMQPRVQAALRNVSGLRFDGHHSAQNVIVTLVHHRGTAPDAWPAWARVLPHVLALAAKHISGWYMSEVAADAVWYLTRSGHYQEALDLGRLLRYWSAYADVFPYVLHAASALAAAHRALGQHDQARLLDEDRLARHRRLRGADSGEALAAATDLACDLHGLGEYQAARELDEETLTRSKQALGRDHPVTLTSAHNLAFDLRALGSHQAASRLARDTLERRRRVLGGDHQDTLTSAASLAAILRDLGQFQAAWELDRDTLTRRRRALGESHPHTLQSEGSLSEELRLLGNAGPARARRAPKRNRRPEPAITEWD
jgi:hypothetical protein